MEEVDLLGGDFFPVREIRQPATVIRKDKKGEEDRGLQEHGEVLVHFPGGGERLEEGVRQDGEHETPADDEDEVGYRTTVGLDLGHSLDYPLEGGQVRGRTRLLTGKAWR